MRTRVAPFALAFGYFACYVPYAAITKALTSGVSPARAGLELLPIMTLASLVAMVVTISALRWWHYAVPAGRRWPRPNRWTFLSGIATSVILITTTLAYTFESVSLAFVMLVMRGGVLVLAPVVDKIAHRHIRWYSWAALGLSLISLADVVATRDGAVPVLCALDLGLYLLAYFVRLRLMEHLGKREDPVIRRRYFVQEQLVATPAAVALIAVLAIAGPASLGDSLRAGFIGTAPAIAALLVVAGLCSQGTGVFGGLLLLEASEATYCVPLNRAASILGGIAAAGALALWFARPAPSGWELAGAALLVAAVIVLWVGPRVRSSRR